MKQIRRIIKRLAYRLGVEIHMIPKSKMIEELIEHDNIHPLATYSPWNLDKGFGETFSKIHPFTLVDIFRCYELWKLVEQSAKLPDGDLIEIGVWRGGTGTLMAKQAKACGIPGRVYLCDTFTGVVKAGKKDSTYKGGEHKDTTREVVEELAFNQMKLDNVQILEGIFPDQTGKEVKDARFRLCHIDVDVYQSAQDIVDWIWDRMVSGGIIVYDDFGFADCVGITKHVEEQFPLKDRLVFHNLNGHAIVVKL